MKVAIILTSFVIFMTTNSHGQACPFNVLGHANARLTTDGIALTRYARGVRGITLTHGLNSQSAASAVEATITANTSRLDVDGDGVFGPTDATLIQRFLAGFSGPMLTDGTIASSGMIEAYVKAGCPLRAPAPPEPALIEWFGTRDTVDAANLQVVAFGFDAEKVASISVAGAPCLRTLAGDSVASVRFDCPLPTSVSSPFSVVSPLITYQNGATTTRGSNWIAPLSYWESVNGVMYVSNVASYVVEGFTDRGPQIDLVWGSTSGLIADVITFPPGTEIRLFGPGGESRCTIRPTQGLRSSYQCPQLATGSYVMDILFAGGTRVLAGASYAIKVVATNRASPFDPVVTIPPIPDPPANCDPLVRKECV